MPTTRSQARSGQPPDCAASSRAYPPGRVSSLSSGVSQQLFSERDVIASIQAVGGGLATPLAAGNERPPAVRKCRSDCLTCPVLMKSKTVISFVTGRNYSAIDIEPFMVHCKLQNYIYMLCCLSCCVQYVGESVVSVNLRMNVHRKGKKGCEIAINHFKNVCPGSKFSVQILEKLPGNGYVNGKVDTKMLEYRLEREDYWIKKCRTVYPYGLNERTKYMCSEKPIGRLFPPLPRYGPRYLEKRTRCDTVNNSLTLDTLIEKILTFETNNKTNELRKIIEGLKRTKLKRIALEAEEKIKENHDTNKRYYDMIIDMYLSKVFKSESNAKTKSPPKYLFPIFFHNKGLDFIQLNQILRKESVKSTLPNSLQNDEVPSVVYNLGNTTRKKILNYKNVVNSINLNDLDTYGTGLINCDCQQSSFRDENHGHIITGDLRFIKNKQLRKLISKGPNYREAKTINWQKCRDEINKGLEECSNRLASSNKNLSGNDMTAWKDKVLVEVDNKIQFLKQKVSPRKVNPILKKPEVINYLNEIHHKYVLVPIDKAANNIAIICKKFYVKVILQELGIIGDPNNTYKITSKSKQEIIDENVTYSKKLGFKITEQEKELPIMYWIPKMHKHPCGKRFIIASKICSTKQLSKSISAVFKLIYHQIENFHKKAKFLSNYNKFWVLQNSDPIINTLNTINKKNNAKSISTFDFSTLYTKLPHDKLIDVLFQLIDFVFKGGNKSFIKVSRNGKASWGKKTKYSIGFTQNSLKIAVKHLIQNSFFTVGNTTIKQTIGIPMGIDPAPFWANLFLYFYEDKYITTLISSNKVKARHFHSTKRFIDDLCAINDGGEFGRSHNEIYPEELDLKVESMGTHASFLNLDIEILDGKFIYKLFDKRDSFPFFIVRMPHMDSNIPKNIFYSALVGEILRIARSTLLLKDFLPKAQQLIKRMANQGADKIKSYCSLSKIISKHKEEFSKFHINDKILIDEILNV